MNLRKLWPFLGRFVEPKRPKFPADPSLEDRIKAAKLPANSVLPLRQKAQREALLKRETVRMALAGIRRKELENTKGAR